MKEKQDVDHDAIKTNNKKFKYMYEYMFYQYKTSDVVV